MFKRRAIASTLASLSFAATASVELIETTITTATRTEVSYAETLAAVSVFTRQDIDRLQAVDVYDLLSRAPGVTFVRNGGRGGASSMLLRGNQGDHSLFLIDGVRIGSATLGSAALASLSLAAVERVEIIRGPKSALYGADAIAGVVNIITRSVSKPREFSIETGFGSNSTSETSLYGGISGNGYSLTASANAFDTDGIDHTTSKDGVNGDDDAFENRSVSVNYRQAIGERMSLNLSYNAYDGENEYDANCGDALTFAPVDCLIYSKTLVDALAGRITVQLSDTLATSLQVGQTRDESDNLAENIDLSSTYNGGEFNTTRKEITWLAHYSPVKEHTLTLGLDYLLDEVDGSTDYAEDERDNKAGFVQLQSDLGRLDALLAARLDDNEQFGDHSTFSASVGYTLSEKLRLVASYGEAFKAPTFNDLYFPFFGNPDFEPEESENIELSLKGSLDDTSFTLSAYRNEVSNLIQYNPAIFAADQTARAEISGIEFDMATEMLGWSIGLNGQLLDPQNKSNGEKLRRRAEQTLSLDADRDFGRFALGFSVRAEGERYEDVANTDKLNAYALLDLRLQYRINERWLIKARLDNAFDKNYTLARSFDLGDFRALGREAHVSVQFRPAL